MKTAIESAFRVFHAGVLRVASLVVPWNQRGEWWREWNAELWHVREACAPSGNASWGAEREVTAFCLGAFQDAAFLRRQRREKVAHGAPLHGSAAYCILFLAAMATASYCVALLLPGVRGQQSLSTHPVRSGLVLIRAFFEDDDAPATLSSAQYRAWNGQKQRYFDGFAFYRVTEEPVTLESALNEGRHPAAWKVARASTNLFALLGLPVMLTGPTLERDANLPRIILSEKVWAREFEANPHVAGSVVRLGQREVRVVGIAPDGARDLPGNVDAWMLEPESAIPSGSRGYVVGHLTELGRAELWRQCVPITAYRADQTEDELLGVSLDQKPLRPWSVFLFASLLALLALPAITSVSLGDSSVSPQRTSWLRRLYRWGFLSAKIALFLPIAFFASIDLAYSDTAFQSSSSVYIQLICSFSICLFGMRWVLQDQRHRCPVCLRRVTHPAYVGQASRTFLAWNGTEMMCMGGHTLLHVPGLPTSWFSTQRWLYLDASWGFLFAGPGTGMENEAITGLSAR